MYSEIRGINIKQLIWKIIFGWKYMLLVATFCAVALVGFKYTSDNKNNEETQNLVKNFTDEQIKNLDSILAQYDRLNYYEKHYEDSVLLKIDTKQYDILEIQYYIESKYTMNLEGDIEKDYTPALVSAYGTFVLNSEYCKDLIDELKLDASVQSVGELTQVNMDKEGAMFKLVISMPTGCTAADMETAVDKIVMEKQNDFLSIGEHTLVKINSSVNRVFSDSLEKKIYDIKNNIYTVRKTIETMKDSLSREQKLYLYNNISYEEYKNEFESAKIVAANIDIKFAIVGVIIGIFIVCAYYLVKEVFSSKLQNEDDIFNLYRIDKVGVIESAGDKKKKFIIDRILMAVKNRNNKNYTIDESIKYIATKVEIICKKNGIDNLVFLETVSNSNKVDILEKISMELKSKGIVIDVIWNILQDCDDLEKTVNVNNVVIIGEIDKTYYSNLEECITVLRQYNVNLLGNIVIE